MATAAPQVRAIGDVRGVFVLGLICTAVFTAAVLILMDRTSYDIWPALIVGPVLILVTLPLLAREAARAGDRKLFTFFVLALLLKFLATIARYWVTFTIFQSADATVYHRYGMALSENFRDGMFTVDLPHIEGKLGPLTGLTETNFIRLFTGIIYTFMGPSKLAGFIFYSWLAFIGLFYLYRAFAVAVPDGSTKSYRRLLFLWPAILYWPSSIGKEAWMMFGLGIAAFGVARILSRNNVVLGIVIAGVGMWLAALVRVHIPAMLAFGLIAAYIIGRSKSTSVWAPIAKGVAMVALIAGGVLLLSRTEEFLKADLTSVEGVTSALEQTSERSAQGGSEFEPAVVRSPLDLPMAFATVMYRPFVFEAHNVTALAAAAQGAGLLVLTAIRLPWIIHSLKGFRRKHPYVIIAVVYILLFTIAFSSFPNFGLLDRQRVQVLPFYFVLMSIPPPSRRKKDDADTAAQGG